MRALERELDERADGRAPERRTVRRRPRLIDALAAAWATLTRAAAAIKRERPPRVSPR